MRPRHELEQSLTMKYNTNQQNWIKIIMKKYIFNIMQNISSYNTYKTKINRIPLTNNMKK